MFSLEINFGCGCVRKESVTHENNDSCKERLVIVLRLHTECNFSLKVIFFSLSLSPVHYQPSRDSKIAVIFSLSLLLWATLGENCLVSVQRASNLENKRRKLRWGGF